MNFILRGIGDMSIIVEIVIKKEIKRSKSMDKNYFVPAQMLENNINEGVKKVRMPILKVILMGILAGMFVAIGAQGSSLAVHSIADPGIAKAVAGTIFPVGLMMIVIVGGQLFTGNCLLTMGAMDKQFGWSKVWKNLTIIFFSNMIGAILIALGVFFAGQLDMGHGALGAYTIKVAVGKVGIGFGQAIVSGILCNVIVCVAILMAGAAKDITGKVLTIFFSIWIFVISGFEHCVANMYYLPAGMLASTNSEYVEKAKELYGLTQAQIDTISVQNIAGKNLLPVTVGNIIGGAVIVAGLMYAINRSKALNK